MGRTLNQKIEQLTPRQKAQVEARAAKLIFEEVSLRALRTGMRRTQSDVADMLGVGQDTVSRLEKRCNIMIATLERYVKAIGGQVSIVAEFPDQPPVKITFADLANDQDTTQNNTTLGAMGGTTLL